MSDKPYRPMENDNSPEAQEALRAMGLDLPTEPLIASALERPYTREELYVLWKNCGVEWKNVRAEADTLQDSLTFEQMKVANLIKDRDKLGKEKLALVVELNETRDNWQHCADRAEAAEAERDELRRSLRIAEADRDTFKSLSDNAMNTLRRVARVLGNETAGVDYDALYHLAKGRMEELQMAHDQLESDTARDVANTAVARMTAAGTTIERLQRELRAANAANESAHASYSALVTEKKRLEENVRDLQSTLRAAADKLHKAAADHDPSIWIPAYERRDESR